MQLFVLYIHPLHVLARKPIYQTLLSLSLQLFQPGMYVEGLGTTLNSISLLTYLSATERRCTTYSDGQSQRVGIM